MKLIISLSVAFACLSQVALANDPFDIEESSGYNVKPLTPTLIKKLRAGGYVLYMRHGNTDTTRTDQLPHMDLKDCSTQRPLSEEGKRVSASVGKYIREAGIPIGEIYSSPLCRSKETTLAAFGPKFKVNNLLMYTANMTENEKAQVLEATSDLLSRPVAGRVNRVLVAHAQNLMDIIGYLPRPEGVVVILKPMGNGKFKYLASVAPSQWEEILQ